MKGSVIIIGGGTGGLFTGAILAKEGFAVTVLEKNINIGGGLQTFIRGGEEFETGMHIMGGLRDGGSIFKLCNWLGILDELDIRDVDADCMDSIHCLADGVTYNIAEGREGFVRSLARYFPAEADNLKRYVQALYDLSQEVDFFYLRPRNEGPMSVHSERFLQAADEFIASYIEDAKLRDILAYMNPMYGGVAHHTPAYIHALINILYINGPSRFAGGSAQLAHALQRVIERRGGQVRGGKAVTRIEVCERRIQYVETADGQRYTADKYISAIHPCTLLALMDETAFPRSYRNRLNEIPNSYSGFSVFVTFREGTFPYINHTCYCQDDYGFAWDYERYDESWPHGFMYMTPPVKEQGAYARKLIVTTPMSFDAVRRWEHTRLGHRTEEYETWKSKCAEKIISKLERIYPDIRSCIREIHTASPLTIRDYYNIKEGSMYGFRKDCQNIALSQLPIYTKIGNLLLTGQNVNLHGICGTPLTAINTAEAIVGEYSIIKKINDEYNNKIKHSGYEND